MPETFQLFTSSRMASFNRCRREHYYRYELGLRPAEDGFALRYGHAFHEAIRIRETGDLHAAREYCAGVGWPDAWDVATLCAQFDAWCWRWEGDPIETLAAEERFELPLRNPGGGTSLTWRRAGKRDARIVYQGRVAIRETKTISEDPQSDRYWQRLLIEPQASFYFLAARDEGLDIDGILYDVIRKPCIAPHKATPPEERKYRKDGALYANQREQDETPDEWRERLYADMLERPDFYFARRLIPRLEQDLDSFAQEVWDVAKDIRAAQLNGRWYRQPDRFKCGGCPYFGFCTGMEQLDLERLPANWSRLENIHPELE